MFIRYNQKGVECMAEIQLKPELEEMIRKAFEQAVATHFTLTPHSRREQAMYSHMAWDLPKVPVADSIDTVLDECGEYNVPVRIYRPSLDKALPVLIYYHGGGFVIDNVMTYDPVCRRLANATQHIVVSPEYRLAPECPYPAAEVDALAVARRIMPKLDELNIPYVKDISVSGDSAGGYLAAVVSAALQDDPDGAITHQVLIYPCLDMTLGYPSTKENGIDKYGSNIKKMQWYFNNYFQHGEDMKAVSPLYGRLTKNMPPTQMFVVHFCPFRDEGKAYVEKLKELGVPTELYEIQGVVHAYINMETMCFDEIQFTYEKMADFLNK
jgi:acetyl esterase